jgi:CheY-like chemotaxis protein
MTIPAPTAVKTKSVLLVDDDPHMRMFYAATLRTLPVSITQVENGMLGLDKIRTKVFDLVLSDLLMPEMSGLEMLLMASDEKIPLPPVIIISSLNEKGVITDCLAMGATDYLTKPVDAIRLKNLVASMLKLNPKRDLTQLMADMVFQKQSGKLVVTTPIGNGFLRYESGRLKEISFNGLSGIDALEALRRNYISDVQISPV